MLGSERAATAVRETAEPYAGRRPAPSEATLVRLWAGQRFPASALVTRQGVPVRVLHPGRRGRGAGPDFRDAVIATPSGGLLRGDVELHVRASDFQAHGHGRDRRYDGVVLHVVFEDDSGEDTLLASGRRVPLVALDRWLRQRDQELRAWLAGPALWREPCHDALARLGEERVRETLEELGDRRFREREAALAAGIRARGAGEALYRALLAGLGYGGTSPVGVAEALPWRELATRLAPANGEERSVLAEALLLGAAGLLPAEREPEGRALLPGAAGLFSSEREPQGRHEARLVALWQASGLTPVHSSAGPASLRPVNHRPANHPARRLAGLAQLLARHDPRPEGLAVPGEALETSPARLIASWTAPAQGYWRDRLAPGLPAARPPGALIGRGRAIELLVNAVLPWDAALAEFQGDSERSAQARGCFARLPRPGPYGALAFLETNLRVAGRPLDARRQQGLLALYKTECTQGGCGRCAFS